METVIVGNGILGLMTAYRLISRDRSQKISIVGPRDRKGCASLAAAAMLNSFCEIESGTLANQVEAEKFDFNRNATSYWPSLLATLAGQSKLPLRYGFGTFLINNHDADTLEDVNFDAIVEALNKFSTPYEEVSPASIPNFKPYSRSRAGRAVYIPNEGWVNPVMLIRVLEDVLQKSGRVRFVADYCESLIRRGDNIAGVILQGGQTLRGDAYVLSPGATFSSILSRSNLEIQTPKILYGIGCSLLLKTDDHTLPNCIRTPNRGLACGVYAAPHDSAHTLIGASNLISTKPEDHPRATSIANLLNGAIEQVNAEYYRSQVVKVNIGWRPTSEDTVPLIGSTSLRNLWIATGTKRDGLHCSPLIAECLSDLIIQGETKVDLSLFCPERKPIKLYSRSEAVEAAVRQMIDAAYQHRFSPSSIRMVEDLRAHYAQEIEQLHDTIGATDWGIPPEMVSVYRAGHLSSQKSSKSHAQGELHREARCDFSVLSNEPIGHGEVIASPRLQIR